MSKRTKQIQQLEEKNKTKRERKAKWQASHTAARVSQPPTVQAQPVTVTEGDKKAAEKAEIARKLQKWSKVKIDPKTVRPVQSSRP